MTRQWLLTAALGACLSVYATDWKFASPDGHIQVVVSDEGGKPSYQVLYDGTVFLEPSPLGLETNIGDFTQDMSLGGTCKADTVCDTYTLPTIKQSRVDYKAVEVVCPFMQQGKKVCDVVFRVSNREWLSSTASIPRKIPYVVWCVRKLRVSSCLRKALLSFVRKASRWEALHVLRPVMRPLIPWMIRWARMAGARDIHSRACSNIWIRDGSYFQKRE